jgi:hypothetical protein
MLTKNIPPKEMWIFTNGVTTKYYRTRIEVVKTIKANRVVTNYGAELWYYNFEDSNSNWKLLTLEEYPS